LLEVARARATAKGYEIAFREGTAEALPVPDTSVDILLSVFGVIFTPDPQRAVAELTRVTANPGRIVLTAWLPGGAMSEVANVSRTAVFRALGQAPPPPFAWHDRATLVNLFEPHGFSVELEEARLVHRGASLDEYVRDIIDVHPLAVAGHLLLEAKGEAQRLRRKTRTILAEANEDPERFAVTSRYVLATAFRPRTASGTPEKGAPSEPHHPRSAPRQARPRREIQARHDALGARLQLEGHSHDEPTEMIPLMPARRSS
jgi:SAM-dependent methyltransferase